MNSLILIRLYQINCFFQLWYGPCSFSNICFTTNDILAFFFRPCCYFVCELFVNRIYFTDFNLSGGCFGTDIIQKCMKCLRSEFTGWKLTRSAQNVNARLFWFDPKQKNENVDQKYATCCCFVKKTLRSTGATPKLEKKQFIR